MGKTQVRLKRIPLEALLTLLQDLYEQGANYIDIIGSQDEIQDMLTITIKEEYFDQDDDDEDEDDTTTDKLSDETLNNLI